MSCQKKTDSKSLQTAPAVLITGVSSGIGKAAALALLAAGYFVIGTVRKPADGQYLNQAGGVAATLDVSNVESISRIAKKMPQLLGNRSLLGIVNNAGISLCVPWQEVSLADFRTQLEVNLIGVAAVTQAFLPYLQKKNSKIIMISSTAARFTTAMMGPYSCSKYALEAMVASLRQELWHDGIQVISLQPGPVNTPIFDKTQKWISKKYARPLTNGVFGKFPEYAKSMGTHGLPPKRVAHAIVHTLQAKRPRLRQLISKNSLWFLLQPLIPTRLLDRMIANALYGKHRKDTSP
ncbi:SDR family NAD(P)-dependent oxidoreductase [bacterium]|nr:SDR family NAD(P)-dependent oxidoreductase [bacterium]